jgi:hypothetical protein
MRQQIAQSIYQFFQGESCGSCAGREFPRHLAKLTLTFGRLFFWFFFADKCPRPLMRFKQPPKFQLAISPHDSVGVDGKIHRKLANRWELIAGGQRPGGNPGSNLIHELTVHGDAGVQIEREFEPAVLGEFLHVR